MNGGGLELLVDSINLVLKEVDESVAEIRGRGVEGVVRGLEESVNGGEENFRISLTCGYQI